MICDDFDLPYTIDEASLRRFIALEGGRVVTYTERGPAGGNPNVVIEFDTDTQLNRFRSVLEDVVSTLR